MVHVLKVVHVFVCVAKGRCNSSNIRNSITTKVPLAATNLIFVLLEERVLTDRKRWEEMPDRQISDGVEGKESRSQQEKCVSISFSEYVSVRQKQRRHSKRKSLRFGNGKNENFKDFLTHHFVMAASQNFCARNLMSGFYDSYACIKMP